MPQKIFPTTPEKKQLEDRSGSTSTSPGRGVKNNQFSQPPSPSDNETSSDESSVFNRHLHDEEEEEEEDEEKERDNEEKIAMMILTSSSNPQVNSDKKVTNTDIFFVTT